ncbi:hypothetical protein [Nocardia sp. NPDC049149]|uniref:hypothetical protein n=1 Tax=Nocardia sp. NPDC049149 TaxID=3364315 RepID=UPI0037236BC6
MAYVCRALDEIRSTLGDDGTDPSTPLQRLLAAVHNGDEPTMAVCLDEVHNALQAAADALGIYGNVRNFQVLGVQGLEVVYRCPIKRCHGRTSAEVDSEPPLCSVNGQELNRDLLP